MPPLPSPAPGPLTFITMMLLLLLTAVMRFLMIVGFLLRLSKGMVLSVKSRSCTYFKRWLILVEEGVKVLLKIEVSGLGSAQTVK